MAQWEAKLFKAVLARSHLPDVPGMYGEGSDGALHGKNWAAAGEWGCQQGRGSAEQPWLVQVSSPLCGHVSPVVMST